MTTLVSTKWQMHCKYSQYDHTDKHSWLANVWELIRWDKNVRQRFGGSVKHCDKWPDHTQSPVLHCVVFIFRTLSTWRCPACFLSFCMCSLGCSNMSSLSHRTSEQGTEAEVYFDIPFQNKKPLLNLVLGLNTLKKPWQNKSPKQNIARSFFILEWLLTEKVSSLLTDV